MNSRDIEAAMRDLESLRRRARSTPMCFTVQGAADDIKETREMVHDLAQLMQDILLGLQETQR